jgi:hypothetical protein
MGRATASLWAAIMARPGHIWYAISACFSSFDLMKSCTEAGGCLDHLRGQRDCTTSTSDMRQANKRAIGLPLTTRSRALFLDKASSVQ